MLYISEERCNNWQKDNINTVFHVQTRILEILNAMFKDKFSPLKFQLPYLYLCVSVFDLPGQFITEHYMLMFRCSTRSREENQNNILTNIYYSHYAHTWKNCIFYNLWRVMKMALSVFVFIQTFSSITLFVEAAVFIPGSISKFLLTIRCPQVSGLKSIFNLIYLTNFSAYIPDHELFSSMSSVVCLKIVNGENCCSVFNFGIIFSYHRFAVFTL